MDNARNNRTMKEQTYADIVTPELLAGAIENNEFHGFREDYHVLHCLLKIHQPKTFLEIGTNLGRGTMIIKNALGEDSKVYSLDLPTELAHISLQHPINEGHGDKVGSLCTLPFIQLRGDSMTFDFSQYPCEGYYIDGEHDFEHPFRESIKISELRPKLIVWHDSDIECVFEAITEAMANEPYTLYRVTDTRIAYAVRNDA